MTETAAQTVVVGSPEEQRQHILLNAQTDTVFQEGKYRFNKDELGNKRSPVTINYAVPSLVGIVEMLEGGNKKEQLLLLEALADVVDSQVKAWVGENLNASQEEFDKVAAKFTFRAISEMEKKDRRSSAIAKEIWEAFAKKYQEVMPAVTGLNPEFIKNATIVFLKKFSLVRTDKATIKKLQAQLSLFVEHADKESLEQFEGIIELLNSKADEFLKSDELSNVVNNLGI